MTITPAPIDPPEIHEKLWGGWSGQVGWDIGANTGQSLGEMSQRFERVETFEPAEECLEQLRENAKMLGNVKVHDLALSDMRGDITLIDIPDKINTGQLVSIEADGMEYDAKQPDAKYRQVAAWTVDALVLNFGFPPNFMKIDVEGHEMKVLKGAYRTIKEHRPNMLIEIHSAKLGEQVRTFLEMFDYEIETVRHPHYTASRGLAHMYDVHFWYKAYGPDLR